MEDGKMRVQTADALTGQAYETVVRLLTRDLLVGSPEGLGLSADMIRLLVTADRAGAFDGREECRCCSCLQNTPVPSAVL